jgi:caffeoyl-CoA O-methyltransferase
MPTPKFENAIPVVEARPQPRDAVEQRILETIEEVARTQGANAWAVTEKDGRLLRILVEAINAQHVVELGTSRGYSGLWIALGLMRTGGRLTTFEHEPGRAATARENHRKAGVAERITIFVGDAHAGIATLAGPIDLLFLDADKEGYIDYLERLLPLVREGGLVIADNMTAPPPDPRYVRAITQDPALETVFHNMAEHGVAITLKKR